MIDDPDRCYRAMQSRDARFDGIFYVAVVSTGIYCRPSCPAITPLRRNCRFHASAASAQQTGFRACKRCRPDAVPGSPEWNIRGDVVGRALRLIGDGTVDRDGVSGLARRLGYSERHLNRLLNEEVGAGPIALARAQRARTARVLVETTDLRLADVAFAAGFASVRQFNDTMRDVFATTPTNLRRARRAQPVGHGTLSLRLAARAPFDAAHVLRFLGARAIASVEHFDGSTYRRTLSLPHGDAVAALRAASDGAGMFCELQLEDLRDLAAAVARLRRLFDLDADPVAVDTALATDPALRATVRRRPGVRVPGAVDGWEILARAILGQQVSVKGARTLAHRLVERFGGTVAVSDVMLTRLFPSAAAVADGDLAGVGMPTARIGALQGAAAAVADGKVVLDAGTDRDATRAALLELPGIGPWTVEYVAMRVFGEPDAFMPTDLGVRKGAERLRIAGDLVARSERWRPWRAYALQHLWLALDEGNTP